MREVIYNELRLATSLSDEETESLAYRIARALENRDAHREAAAFLGNCQFVFLTRVTTQNGADVYAFLKAVGKSLGIPECHCQLCRKYRHTDGDDGHDEDPRPTSSRRRTRSKPER